MVTIKTKKEMNLPQLIEWGFRNNIENKSYKTNDAEGYELYFDSYGTPRFSSFVNKHDTFTVEIEEEIDEDTRLDELVVRYRNDDIYIFPQERINDFKNDSSIVAFYIPNDDFTLTLIWRNGKLVE